MQITKSKGRRHPQHNQIHETIRSWFRRPMDAMGMRAVVRHWGTYWDHGDVYPSGLLAGDIPSFLTDLNRFYADRKSVQVVIDKADVGSTLDVAFADKGWARQIDTAFLAHTGVFPGGAANPNLSIQPATEANLTDCASVLLLAFSDLEKEVEEMKDASLRKHIGEQSVGQLNAMGPNANEPSVSAGSESSAVRQLEGEAERLQAEMTGSGAGLVASFDGVPAGALWCYEEAQDLWISRLGVRKPFRGQGIAHALLKHQAAAAYSSGYRSVVINVRVDNVEALQLYRRLGFRDEVCRQRRYCIQLGSPPSAAARGIRGGAINVCQEHHPHFSYSY